MNSFSNEWGKYTSDPVILEIVQGLKLEFMTQPPSQTNWPYPLKLNIEERQAIGEEVNELLRKQVIEKTNHEKGAFISNVFSRPKKDGGLRMILDLSKLNLMIEYHHFKMDTLETALKLVTKNCFMASIDLQDAYYSVPIAPQHRKYLKFFWNDSLYQFKALPNGLTSGPRVFTKLLKPPFAWLRSQGYVILGYIDDTLLIALTEVEAKRAVQNTAKVLSELGFIIHPRKSIFKPTKEIIFLGFKINSQFMTVTLTEQKIVEIKDLCKNLLRKQKPSIRMVAMVIGKLVAAFPGVQYGPLHYRELEKDKTRALCWHKGNYDARITLNLPAREELDW